MDHALWLNKRKQKKDREKRKRIYVLLDKIKATRSRQSIAFCLQIYVVISSKKTPVFERR